MIIAIDECRKRMKEFSENSEKGTERRTDMNKLLTFGEFIKICTDLATVTGFKEEMFNSTVCFELEGFQIPIESVSWDIERGRVIIHETKVL